MPRPRCSTLALIIIGALTVVAGVAMDDRFDASDLRSVGIVVLMSALGWFALRRVTSPASHAAYELGRKEGFEEGYDEGRAVVRPVVVTLGKRCCGSCQRTGKTPAAVAEIDA